MIWGQPKQSGRQAKSSLLDDPIAWAVPKSSPAIANDDLQALNWMLAAGLEPDEPVDGWSQKFDAVLLHPVWGSLILVSLLFLIFQAVFAGAPANTA